MGYRRVYTSTIRVPIYAGWRCQNCNEVNFAQGIISCMGQYSTNSIRSSKQEEAKAKASAQAQQAWLRNAFNIIHYTKQYPTEVRNNLIFQNTRCTKCKKKPKWDNNTNLVFIFCTLGIILSIISGLVTFALLTNVIAWAIFVAIVGITIGVPMFIEKNYKNYMASLPAKYVPVIGSHNLELKEYAVAQGVDLPTPEQIIDSINPKMQSLENEIIYNDNSVKIEVPRQKSSDISEEERVSLLKSYKELLDTGALTQEEYEAKKRQLLGL